MLHAYSLYETKTWLQKAHNRGLITDDDHSALQNNIETIAIKLNKYINTIGKK
jgi:four helix bundle protein